MLNPDSQSINHVYLLQETDHIYKNKIIYNEIAAEDKEKTIRSPKSVAANSWLL